MSRPLENTQVSTWQGLVCCRLQPGLQTPLLSLQVMMSPGGGTLWGTPSQMVLQGSLMACEAGCISPPSLTAWNIHQQQRAAFCLVCLPYVSAIGCGTYARAPTSFQWHGWNRLKACLQVHGFLLCSAGLQLSHSLVEVLLQSLGAPVLVLSMLLRSLQFGQAFPVSSCAFCRGQFL